MSGPGFFARHAMSCRHCNWRYTFWTKKKRNQDTTNARVSKRHVSTMTKMSPARFAPEITWCIPNTEWVACKA